MCTVPRSFNQIIYIGNVKFIQNENFRHNIYILYILAEALQEGDSFIGMDEIDETDERRRAQTIEAAIAKVQSLQESVQSVKWLLHSATFAYL